MKPFRILAAFATAFGAGGAIAGPADYVFVPAVEYGERELDFGLQRKQRFVVAKNVKYVHRVEGVVSREGWCQAFASKLLA